MTATLFRYDNERNKGDHKHIGGIECPYIFRTLNAAFADFITEIKIILNKDNAP